jgi:hypothetical protein
MEVEMSKPKYDVEVELIGHDGNAFLLLGKVRRALKQAGAPKEEIEKFLEEAMSGDYDHLLATCMDWVEVS